MGFLRKHWFDIGLVLAAFVGLYIVLAKPVFPLPWLYWLNLSALFLHQFEEYRWPGNFPNMINTVMFHSSQPDRFPLNSNSAFIINLTTGWVSYLLAVLFGAHFLWLGIAVMLISVGNFIAHTFLFNIRGKTRYSPGMVTAILFFAPISAEFFYQVIDKNLASPLDWGIGILSGLTLNYLGILKMINWLKNKQTAYIFQKGN